MIEEFTINGIHYTHYTNENGEFYEATKRNNVTGFGDSAVEALLDLRKKTKALEKRKIFISSLN